MSDYSVKWTSRQGHQKFDNCSFRTRASPSLTSTRNQTMSTICANRSPLRNRQRSNRPKRRKYPKRKKNPKRRRPRLSPKVYVQIPTTGYKVLRGEDKNRQKTESSEFESAENIFIEEMSLVWSDLNRQCGFMLTDILECILKCLPQTSLY